MVHPPFYKTLEYHINYCQKSNHAYAANYPQLQFCPFIILTYPHVNNNIAEF